MEIKENLTRIASFSVNHDYIVPGIYISRVDGDITTYDLRTRKPNSDEYMDNLTMHSTEHMLATLLRNSDIKDRVIYFGPMGCQTGFYLLVRNSNNEETLGVLITALREACDFQGEIPGKKREECGNFENLDLAAAKAECKRYLEVLTSKHQTFDYPQE